MRRPWRTGLSQASVLAAVLVASIVPRLAGLRLAFAGGELMQWDGDSAYHLKRILHAVAQFPELPRFDLAMNWPTGAPCPWPDGFDLLAAAWALLLGGGDPQRATMAVLLFTPMLGVLVVWAAMDLARLVIPFGPAHGAAVVAAGALTSMVPSALYFSQFGFLDHHIAETLAALLLAGWALRRLPVPGTSSAGSPLSWEVGGALATTFALWVFAGGILYVALSCAIVLIALLRDEHPRFLGSGVPALLTASAASALLALPAIQAHGRLFSYQFPSLLQPLLVASGAAALALALVVTRITSRLAGRAGLLALGGLALSLAAAIGLSQAAREVQAGLLGWLLRRDPWIATIAEFQPLSGDERGLLMALFTHFGAIGFSAPVLLAVGGWAIVRAARARGLAFVLLSAGFVLFTFNQVRFGRVGVPLLMIHCAAVFAAIAHRRRTGSSALAVRAFPVIAAAVLIACDPMLRPTLSPRHLALPPVVTAALDLRGAAPDATRGVLTPWDLGHVVSVMSGLPTPTNGFGPYLDPTVFEEAEAVFRKDPETLEAFLERRRIGYVLGGAMIPALLSSPSGRSPFVRATDVKGAILDLEYMRSFGLSPLVIGGSGIPGSDVRHLEHLMPIFATRERPPGLAFALPALWVYERVPGARLAGTAPPGARVIAALDFREQGRPHVWRAFTETGSDGRFEMVVPFPTAYARPTLSSAPRYALRVGEGQAVLVEVPERSVRAGEVVRVGEIRAAKPASPQHTRQHVAPGPPPG